MATLLPGNILYSGPITFDEILKCKSLGSFILEKLAQFPNKILMIEAVTGKTYTGKTILDSTFRMINVFRSLGIKRGDVIGISSENRFEYAIALYASFALNAIVAPINLTYSQSEMDHAINLSKPKLMFVSKQTVERISQVVVDNYAFVKHLISFDAMNSSTKILSYKELMEENRRKVGRQTNFQPAAANKEEDVALIVCSSGTTGLPKGVQLTQMNMLSAIDPTQVEATASMSELTTLTVIPWFHVFGCLTLISAAAMGAKLVFLNRFTHESFLNAIQKYKIMLIFMVPPLMVFLAKHPDVEKYDLSSLKILCCGAAPLTRETEDLIKKRIGETVMIRQGYGLSESTRGVTLQNDKYCKPGSVGALKKGLYAKVVDPDTGKTLGHNQRGELCFKGTYIMKGYIGDVQSTQSVIKDGWLHTGDVGYFDDDFEFFIVDRIKELIKYKAFQVPPAEIEALLLTNSKIRDAAVIGKPDEEAGELPMAFVVKQDNVNLSEDEVIQYVADRTSPAKRLRGGVIFVNEIPKNPSGKILRRVLRDMLNSKHKSKL